MKAFIIGLISVIVGFFGYGLVLVGVVLLLGIEPTPGMTMFSIIAGGGGTFVLTKHLLNKIKL